jgi:hypothetical protein
VGMKVRSIDAGELQCHQTASHGTCAAQPRWRICCATRIAATRSMLAETYNWFTEGFDTADLKDAKALLDELSGSLEAPSAGPVLTTNASIGYLSNRAVVPDLPVSIGDQLMPSFQRVYPSTRRRVASPIPSIVR